MSPFSYYDVGAALQERVPTSFKASITMFTPATKAIAAELDITSDETAEISIDGDLPPSF